VTDAQGQASTTWTLGSTSGTQTLIAELAQASTVFVSFTAEAVPATIAVPTAVAASPSFGEGGFEGFAVSWESSDANVERFRVERRLNGDETWTTVADNLPSDARDFFDGHSFGTDREVTYRVQGCDAAASNCSGFGVSDSPVYTPPAAPTGLAAEVTGSDESGILVSLTWTDTNLFEDSYEICDSQTQGGACEIKSVSPDTESLNFSTPPADSVLVTVTAVNPTDRASASIWVQLVTLADFSISVVSGDNQSGTVDSGLNDPVVVEVRDAFGAVAQGIDVFFTAQDGGIATPEGAVTDGSGRASTTWTLGSATGTQTLIAELREAPSVSVVASAEAAAAPISAPTGVEASPSFDGEGFDFIGFEVFWDSSDPNAERFRVERLLNGGSWETVADNLPPGELFFFDDGGAGFPTDREVTYRVQACDAAATNCSGFGVSQTPVYTMPTPPANVVAQITGTNPVSGSVNVRVDWTDTNTFETLYEACDRADLSLGCFPQALPPNSESALFTSTTPDSAFFTVKVYNETGVAATSVKLIFAPQAPSSVVATPLVEEGLTGFEVDWTGDDVATAFYEVERSLTNGEVWDPANPDLEFPGNYLDLGPEVWDVDREVIYRVRGCNANACSAWTETFDVVYTLPRTPTGLSLELIEIIEDGPYLELFWVDNNDFEIGYDICDTDGVSSCDPADVIEVGANVEFKEFLSILSPFDESITVTVWAVNETGLSDPAEISISLPGAGSDSWSIFSGTPGIYSSPFGFLGVSFENLEESNIHVGNFFYEGFNTVCALDVEDVFCTSAMGISFQAPVWGLEVFHGQDENSGVQGDLELILWDNTTVTVQLSGDGDPTTTESTDLSAFGTIVGMTWKPGSSELGFSRFQFIAETGAFPDPPTFTPPTPTGASPTALDRARRR
jgi:hypothetical protein